MNARVAVIIITFLSASISGWAQRTTPGNFGNTSTSNFNDLNNVTVVVHGVNDAAVADAHVEARDVATGQIAASGYTNTSGTVEFPALPNGTYEMVATVGLTEAHERTDTRFGNANVILRMPGDATPAAGNNESVSVAQFKVPGKAREEFKKAEESLHKQHVDDCKKHIAKALEIYPNFAEALTLRGVLAIDELKQDAAIADLDAAIKADPSYPLAYVVMGASYNTVAKFDDAIRVLGRGIALAPNSWQAYFELGKAQIGKGSFEAALRALDKAQSMGPQSYAVMHLVKAHALLGLKDYTDAMGELQAFLDKGPKDGPQAQDARNLMGKVQAFSAGTSSK